MSYLPLSHLLACGRPDDYPVALTEGNILSFGEFRSDVLHNAYILESIGCRRGALVCQDSYWFAVGLFALLHTGAAVVMLPNGRPGTLESLSGEYDLLLSDGTEGQTETICLESNQGWPRSSDIDPIAGFDASDAIIDCYTSGSAGMPKRVPKAVLLLEREVAVLDDLWRTQIGMGPVLSTVSHQHIYGLTFKLLWPLCTGRPFVGSTHQHWEAIAADMYPDRTLVTSPAHLSRLGGLDAIAFDRRPSMVFSAGAPLPESAASMAKAILGTAVTEIFGSTETGAIATRQATGAFG